MEDILTQIYNAFEPNVAAPEKYYLDCKEARGGGALVTKMIGRLKKARGPIRFLFTGHLGCGKSSELLHLAAEIEKTTTFFPVYIDLEEYLDKQDATLEDVFLAMFTEIAYRCREKFEIKSIHESYSLIKKIYGFFSEVSVKGEAGLPFDLAKFSIEKLRQNPSLRSQIREAIKGDEKRSLFTELNDFISEMELKLIENTEFKKLVIIADSLEKIKRFEKSSERGDEDEIESQKRLFIDQAERLNGIATNIVYTIPLSLYRSDYGTQLQNLYGKSVVVLPMVKVHKRGDFEEPYLSGIEELKEIIEKRLTYTGASIEEVFEKEALAYLIKNSGGHIRSLMRFIQEASDSVERLPIDMKAAREPFREEVRGFAASVREEYWDKLARLELSGDQHIANGDNEYSKMLENLAILEYMNGNEVEEEDDRWYAVNPAVRKTKKFEQAVKKLSSAKDDQGD